jgi:hypothetical protein
MKLGLLFSVLLATSTAFADGISTADSRIEKVRDSVHTANLPGRTIAQHRIAYMVSTCLFNREKGTPLANLTARVSYADDIGPGEDPNDSVRQFPTDGRGCIHWVAFLSEKDGDVIPPTLKHVKITVDGFDKGTELTLGLFPNQELTQFGLIGDPAVEMLEELKRPTETTFTQEQLDQIKHQ